MDASQFNETKRILKGMDAHRSTLKNSSNKKHEVEKWKRNLGALNTEVKR